MVKDKRQRYIYSFNGPHSLFVDTIRSCRILVISHLLGHVLKSENDSEINLLAGRLNILKQLQNILSFMEKGETGMMNGEELLTNVYLT